MDDYSTKENTIKFVFVVAFCVSFLLFDRILQYFTSIISYMPNIFVMTNELNRNVESSSYGEM